MEECSRMGLKELKETLQNKQIPKLPIIFILGDGDKFLLDQYISAILNFSKKQINYITDLSSFNTQSFSWFKSDVNDNNLYCYKCEVFNEAEIDIRKQENLIIVCTKINPELSNIYADIIINIPKLLDWQIKEYVYSLAYGVNTKYLDWLITNCNNNIYRLSLECDKIALFESNSRDLLFKEMMDEGAFWDISNKTIFDFTNAILRKDINALKSILISIQAIDVDDFGLVVVLLQNFKKIISVWMNSNPTPANTGLTDKQIYAISKLPRVWSANELVNKVALLSEMDMKIKSGYIPTSIVKDYLLVNLL